MCEGQIIGKSQDETQRTLVQGADYDLALDLL